MLAQETVLESGLRVVTIELSAARRVHACIEVGAGCIYDPADQDGLFHYYEHMAFMGTPTMSQKEILQWLRRHSLEYNACTGHQEVSYYVEVLPSRLEDALILLTDIYFYPTFPQDQLDREREAILNEILEHLDDDEQVAAEAVWSRLWQKNPLRRYGVGTEEGVASVIRDDLVATQESWYIPSNTTVYVAGSVRHDDVVSCMVGLAPSGNGRVVERLSWDHETDDLPKENSFETTRQDREQGAVALGCKLPPDIGVRNQVLNRLMTSIYFSSNASLLIEELREKRGWVYGVDGDYDIEYPLGGFFSIGASTSPKRIDSLVEVAREVLFSPFTDQVFFDEVHGHLLDLYELGQETPEEWVEQASALYASGRDIDDVSTFYPECRDVLKTISIEELEEHRAKYFRPERFVTAIVRPA